MHIKFEKIDGWKARAKLARWKASSLAKSSGIGERELLRHFKERFRASPHAWISRQRLLTARAMLRQGKSVKAVAMEVGFANTGSLTRAFKRWFKITPSAFQQRGRGVTRARPSLPK